MPEHLFGGRRKFLQAATATIIDISLMGNIPTSAQAQTGWVDMDFNSPTAPWRYVEPEFDPLPRRLWSHQSLKLWFPVIPRDALPTIEGPLRNLDRWFEMVTGQAGQAWEIEEPGFSNDVASGKMDLGFCDALGWAALQRPEPVAHFEPDLGETIGLVDKLGMLLRLHKSDGHQVLSQRQAVALLNSGEPLIGRRREPREEVWNRIVIATNGSRLRLTNFGNTEIEADLKDMIGLYTPIYMYGDRGIGELHPQVRGSVNQFVVDQRRFILRLVYPELYGYAPLNDFIAA